MSILFRPSSAILLLTVSLPSVFLCGCAGPSNSGSANEANTASKELEGVQASLNRIEAKLAELQHGISNETVERLKRLEDALNDPKQWPQGPEDAERLRDEVDRLVQNLPPTATEKILPQLVRINWGVEALWNLRTLANTPTEQLEEVQTAIKEVMERHPQQCFHEIYQTLEGRMGQIEPQLRACV